MVNLFKKLYPLSMTFQAADLQGRRIKAQGARQGAGSRRKMLPQGRKILEPRTFGFEDTFFQ
tara:strand:+ start:37 stop:222 length:186 start_codon:yes stop_codon:yes gene_type:complete